MFNLEQSVLLVVDVQGKLATLMQNRNKLYSNIQVLLRAAQILNLPIFHTEQMPEKIGKTIPQIVEVFPYLNPFSKVTFSAWRCGEFQKKIQDLKRKQIIISGIEAHICVYQTVADLLEAKYQVKVVGDAISSRTDENLEIAVDEMRNIGAGVSSTEMIICELLRTADHPRFKEVLELIK